MSTHTVEVFEMKLLPHPNAHSLSIVRFKDYQCVVRTELWKDGDLAAFIPPDSILPEGFYPDFPRLVRAIRLRGEISEGCCVPAPEGAQVGDNVMDVFGIVHYEPAPEEVGPERSLNPPSVYTPCYDLENAKKYSKSLFKEGDLIVITEKIHGENWRGLYDGETLHVGSRTEWKQNVKNQSHWKALTYNVKNALENMTGYMFIGEATGRVRNFDYGIGPHRAEVFVFDIYDTFNKTFLSQDHVTKLCKIYGLRRAPILYEGLYTGNLQDYLGYAEGESRLGDHIREGCVIRHAAHRALPGHVVPALKLIGIDYLSGKKRKK